MSERWKGKFAIISGASSGIGASIMKNLALKGINVIALARRKEKIEEIVKEIGETEGKIFAHRCDVSDFNSISETVKWIEENFGCVNILVNNAGVNFNVNIIDQSDEATDKLNKTIDTNFTGIVHMTRAVVALMRKSDDYSVIVNINSIIGHIIPFISNKWNLYPSTKFAITAFSEILRQELIVNNVEKIRVTSLSPGLTATNIAKAGGFTDENEEDSEFSDMPRLRPDDVSQSVLFILDTPYNVNVTELTIRPVGEKF